MDKRKIKWIAQKTVLSKGFTKGLIDKLLPEPRLVDNPHYKCAPKMRLWDESVVLAAMETPEFKEAQLKLAKLRAGAKEAAQKGIATKKQNLLDSMLHSVEVSELLLLSDDEVCKLAIEHVQSRYDNYNQYQAWCGNYDDNGMIYYKTTRNADEATIKRWAVNYIRHELSCYDDIIQRGQGKVGQEEAYSEVKIALLKKIAKAFPSFSDECERQIEQVELGDIAPNYWSVSDDKQCEDVEVPTVMDADIYIDHFDYDSAIKPQKSKKASEAEKAKLLQEMLDAIEADPLEVLPDDELRRLTMVDPVYLDDRIIVNYIREYLTEYRQIIPSYMNEVGFNAVYSKVIIALYEKIARFYPKYAGECYHKIELGNFGGLLGIKNVG